MVNTARIGVAKPDPRVYSIAAERVGATAERCLFIDDTEANVTAAREAGMAALHYRDLDQLVTLGLAQFIRHRTAEPFNDDDLVLAEEIVARAAVSVDNARRYTRERRTALALQRSLLPERPPTLPAVEVAYRYLPSGPGTNIGGDWFDVIPLSGARVALVVGDVVGHGLHASATIPSLTTS
ncbi:PP2C family protein-serine/threonine phosphatase [Streptomyces sp. NPDC000345]|uniref:PP2C family protein-serine/threonine phosphatase n=1 Tax=Streptomyces sp. NPDC000345 TaxID=3364537 RepID=UPI0036C47887